MKEKVFEKQSDRTREIDTLNKFCEAIGVTFKIHQPMSPVDASVYKGEKRVCFAEVKTMNKDFAKINDIRISLRKLANVQKYSLEEESNCCIVYRFNNNRIGYFWLSDIKNSRCSWGGMKNPRKGSLYDRELMVYIPVGTLRMI